MIWEWHNCHPGLRSNLNKRYFWKKILVDSLKVIPHLKRRRLCHDFSWSHLPLKSDSCLFFVFCMKHFVIPSTFWDKWKHDIWSNGGPYWSRDHGKIEWFTIEVFFFDGGFYNCLLILEPWSVWFFVIGTNDFVMKFTSSRDNPSSGTLKSNVLLHLFLKMWNAILMMFWVFCFWCFVFFVFCWVFGSSTWILGGRQQYCTGTKTAISQVLGAPNFFKVLDIENPEKATWNHDI